jgi:hypothetical protein
LNQARRRFVECATEALVELGFGGTTIAQVSRRPGGDGVAIVGVATAVIIVLPRAFPSWLKIEEGARGLLLIGVLVLVNSKVARSSFTSR